MKKTLMKKTLYLLVFVLALALAYATSQTGGSSSAPNQSQPPSTTIPSTTGTTPTKSDNQNGAGAATTQSSGGELQGQIQNALKNEPTLANDNVNVSVSDNEIDLSGTVATSKERLTAKRIAQSFAGNRKVKEHLTMSGQDNAHK
ncbi:MAG TPA: BON domain-containing protein [Candidatus Angelobacter sp.]